MDHEDTIFVSDQEYDDLELDNDEALLIHDQVHAKLIRLLDASLAVIMGFLTILATLGMGYLLFHNKQNQSVQLNGDQFHLNFVMPHYNLEELNSKNLELKICSDIVQEQADPSNFITEYDKQVMCQPKVVIDQRSLRGNVILSVRSWVKSGLNSTETQCADNPTIYMIKDYPCSSLKVDLGSGHCVVHKIAMLNSQVQVFLRDQHLYNLQHLNSGFETSVFVSLNNKSKTISQASPMDLGSLDNSRLTLPTGRLLRRFCQGNWRENNKDLCDDIQFFDFDNDKVVSSSRFSVRNGYNSIMNFIKNNVVLIDLETCI